MSNAVPGSSYGWASNRPRNNYSMIAPTQGTIASITIGGLANFTHVLTGFTAELRISGTPTADAQVLQIIDGGSGIIGHTMFIAASATAFDRFAMSELNIPCAYGAALIIKFAGIGAPSAEELSIFWHDAG